MKKTNWLFGLILSCLIFFTIQACKDDYKSQKNGYSKFLGEETTYPIGSWANDVPEITIPEEALDSIFRWFFSTLGDEVTYQESYISDSLGLDEPIIYLVLKGILNSDDGSAVLGLQLIRNDEDQTYIFSEIAGGKWTCTGSNCSACKGEREHWYSSVTSCTCTSPPVDPTKKAVCNHSTSGGGNGAAWVGVAVSIIIAILSM